MDRHGFTGAEWWGIIAMIAALAGRGMPTGAEQVLRNPGFEESQGELPAQWAANGPVARSEPGRSGQVAVKLGTGGRVLECFALEGGFVYHGRVWARGSGKLSLEFYEYRDGPGQGYAGGVGSGALDVTSEWQEFLLTYSQGPNEKEFQGLAFALSGGGEGAEVIVDDASVEKVPVPAVPPNLLLNPEFSDADGDGGPDRWHGEKRRLRIETGPGGLKGAGKMPALRSVRCAATLFSEDYRPDLIELQKFRTVSPRCA
jgi:hypothetical protein